MIALRREAAEGRVSFLDVFRLSLKSGTALALLMGYSSSFFFFFFFLHFGKVVRKTLTLLSFSQAYPAEA